MAFKRKKEAVEGAAPTAPKPPKAPKAAKAPKAPKASKASKRAKEGDAAAPKAKSGRKQRFVIIIGDDGAILVYMQGSTVVRRLFAPSAQPDHTASIIELMQTHPNVPLYILADVMDQQYVRHTFPPVSSLSVSGLVKRRLDRDFQAEDLKGSLPLGRDKTGRKEWNYLLIALASTPLMQQWLEMLVELPNELKGIYLVPVESQQYIGALKKAIGGPALSWQLLVTHNKVSGFRQVVLREGKLVFTRVTQAIDDGVAAVIAGNIEQEIINTLEYLRRLGFTDNAQIEMFVITAQEVKETLDLNRFKAGGAHVVTPLDIADALGLQQAALSADRFGDVVMAAWFGIAKKRVLKFLTVYAQRLSKIYAARRGLLTVAVLGALALTGMSIMNGIQYVGDSNEASQIESQRAPLQAQMNTVKQTLDGLDKGIAFKAAVVSVKDAFLKNTVSPLQFAADLAKLMTPEQRVASINWDNPIPAEGSSPTPPTAKVTIEFVGTYTDVENLTKSVDGFIAELKKQMPRYTITAAPYPWLTSSTSSMEISFGQQQANAPAITQGQVKVDLTFVGPNPEGEAAPDASVPPPDGVMP